MRDLIRSAWLIAAAVLIPLLLFVVFQAGFSAREERRAIESRSLAEARSIIVSSESAIARTVGALDALSTIQALRTGNVEAAYRRAREIASFNPNWVSVELARVDDGAILFDLRRPFDARAASLGKRAPGPLRLGAIVPAGAGCPCIAITRAHVRTTGPSVAEPVGSLSSA